MGLYEDISRKRLLQMGSGLGVAGLLAACGGSTSGGGSSSAAGGDTTAAAGGSSAADTGASSAAGSTDAGSSAAGSSVALPTFDAATESGTLTVFDWQGYEIKEFWGPYNDGQGKKVPLKFVFLEDDQQALAKVKAGFAIDVAHPCIAYTRDWKDAGLIQPWDTSKIENWDTVNPNLYDAGQIDGQSYAVPWDWGFSSLVIRTDRVDPKDFTGWEGILNDKYKKRISIFSDGVAITKIGHLINKGADDPNKLDQAAIDASKETMLKAVKNIRNFWTSESDAIKDFVAGNIDVCYAWPGTWYQIQQGLVKKGIDPATVQYIQPTQGRLGWVCAYVLGKETKLAGSAHSMMSTALSVPTMANLINMYYYGAANGSAEVIAKVTDKSLVTAFGLDDPTSLDPPKVWKEAYLPNRVAYIKAAEEVKASL